MLEGYGEPARAWLFHCSAGIVTIALGFRKCGGTQPHVEQGVALFDTDLTTGPVDARISGATMKLGLWKPN